MNAPTWAELRRLRAAALDAAARPHTDPAVLAQAAVDGLDCYGDVVRDLGFDPLQEKR